LKLVLTTFLLVWSLLLLAGIVYFFFIRGWGEPQSIAGGIAVLPLPLFGLWGALFLHRSGI
jgi:hypothetical protein